MIDKTHNAGLKSWVESANRPGADFPIQNLPFAMFRPQGDERPRAGVAIGNQVLDATAAFGIASVGDVMAMNRNMRVDLRRTISEFLVTKKPGAPTLLTPIESAEFELPCRIGDYTDFYASIHHATNVGSMFRPDNPLLPNYKWLPVAYHGRVSTIVPSGTAVRRPWGQITDSPAGPPVYAPTRRLDYELEIGAFLGPGSRMGQPVPAALAGD